MNELHVGDAITVLKTLPDNSIDAVITDPPYHLDKLSADWNNEEVTSNKNMKVVTSLPSGMRFDPEQGKRFYSWYILVSEELLRVLKPGGFFFSFSAPRLYHRMVCAIEDAGFDIRDQFIWLYTQNQAKAMSLNHVIARLPIDKDEKEKLQSYLSGWKTPQVKSCHEPIVMAQKPLMGSFLSNYNNYGVGLVNTETRIGEGMFPSNVASTEEFDDVIDRFFLVSKPNKKEKGEFNFHLTVKPLSLMSYLIALTTRQGQVVLDPFVGSGTTVVAAKNMDRRYVGIDLNKEYVEITKKRLTN